MRAAVASVSAARNFSSMSQKHAPVNANIEKENTQSQLENVVE